MTSQTTTPTPARQLYDELTPLMKNLYARWLDECKHEDIADYGKVIAQRVTNAGGTFLKMQKRPFGFQCTMSTAVYLYTISARSYSYKRIG